MIIKTSTLIFSFLFATAAAEMRGSKFNQETRDRTLMGMGMGMGMDEPHFTATFDDESLLVGSVTLVQTGEEDNDLAQGVWTVTIDNFIPPADICPGFTGELNWHIHVAPIGLSGDQSMCGSEITGGHYDPTYACGPASDFAGPVCDFLELETRPGYDYSTVCQVSNPSGCELGDLSGKMGRVDATTTETQVYYDFWLGNVANLKDTSILFHCCTPEGCSPRVACANFVVTDEGEDFVASSGFNVPTLQDGV